MCQKGQRISTHSVTLTCLATPPPTLPHTHTHTHTHTITKKQRITKTPVALTERVVPVRLELTTLGLLDPRSNQLSYETWLSEKSGQGPESHTKEWGRGCKLLVPLRRPVAGASSTDTKAEWAHTPTQRASDRTSADTYL